MSLGSSTTQRTVRSRRGSRQIRHCSASATLPHVHAEPHLVLDLGEGVDEAAYVGRVGREQVEGDPLGALGTDPGQPPELVDEVLHHAFVHASSLRATRSTAPLASRQHGGQHDLDDARRGHRCPRRRTSSSGRRRARRRAYLPFGALALRRLTLDDVPRPAAAVRRSHGAPPALHAVGDGQLRRARLTRRLPRAEQRHSGRTARPSTTRSSTTTDAWLGGVRAHGPDRAGRPRDRLLGPRRPRSGTGYATRAAAALTDAGLGVAGVDRVEIHHDRANAVSGRVPARLGYERLREQPGRWTRPRRHRGARRLGDEPGGLAVEPRRSAAGGRTGLTAQPGPDSLITRPPSSRSTSWAPLSPGSSILVVVLLSRPDSGGTDSAVVPPAGRG